MAGSANAVAPAMAGAAALVLSKIWIVPPPGALTTIPRKYPALVFRTVVPFPVSSRYVVCISLFSLQLVKRTPERSERPKSAYALGRKPPPRRKERPLDSGASRQRLRRLSGSTVASARASLRWCFRAAANKSTSPSASWAAPRVDSFGSTSETFCRWYRRACL
jgi:hypothetical protein